MKPAHRVDPDAVELARHLAEAVADRRGPMSLRAVAVSSGVHHSSVNRLVRGQGADRPTLDTLAALARWAGLRVALVPADLPGLRLAETVRRLRVDNDNLRRRLAAAETERTIR